MLGDLCLVIIHLFCAWLLLSYLSLLYLTQVCRKRSLLLSAHGVILSTYIEVCLFLAAVVSIWYVHTHPTRLAIVWKELFLFHGCRSPTVLHSICGECSLLLRRTEMYVAGPKIFG